MPDIACSPIKVFAPRYEGVPPSHPQAPVPYHEMVQEDEEDSIVIEMDVSDTETVGEPPDEEGVPEVLDVAHQMGYESDNETVVEPEEGVSPSDPEPEPEEGVPPSDPEESEPEEEGARGEPPFKKPRGCYMDIKKRCTELLIAGKPQEAAAALEGYDFSSRSTKPRAECALQVVKDLQKWMRGDARFHRDGWVEEVRRVLDEETSGLDPGHPDVVVFESLLTTSVAARYTAWYKASKPGLIQHPPLARAIKSLDPMCDFKYHAFRVDNDLYREGRAAVSRRVTNDLSNKRVYKEDIVIIYVTICIAYLQEFPGKMREWRERFEGKTFKQGKSTGVTLLTALAYKAVIALQVVTGRRPRGILKSITFWEVPGKPLQMQVKGVPKTDKDRVFTIPVLCDAALILEAVTLLRSTTIKSRWGSLREKGVDHNQIRIRHTKWFLGEGLLSQVRGKVLAPGVDFVVQCKLRRHPVPMYTDIRGLYALVAFERRAQNGFEPGVKEMSIWIHKALAHSGESSTSCIRIYERVTLEGGETGFVVNEKGSNNEEDSSKEE